MTTSWQPIVLFNFLCFCSVDLREDTCEELRLLHLDTSTTCRLQTVGMNPHPKCNRPAAGVVKVPVHVVRRIVSPQEGIILDDSTEQYSASPHSSSRKPTSSTIIDWRVILVVYLGCGTGFGCIGKFQFVQCFLINDLLFVCFVADTFGPGGSPVYIVDLTPIYRQFPPFVAYGLDPRLASPDGLARHENSSMPEGPWITSDEAPLPPWEQGIVPPPDSQRSGIAGGVCGKVGPLRWHRVQAMGNHIEWTPRGLGIALPPRDASFAVFDTPTAVLEPDYNGNPFYGYPLSGEYEEIDGGKRRRFPALAYTAGLVGATSGIGIYQSSTVAVGHTGPMGWLGVPTLMSRVGLVRGNDIGSTASNINVFATVHIDVVEGSYGLSPPWDALDAHDSLANNSWLDERVLFWGLFSDENEMQGVVPPAARGTKAAEVPLSELSPPTLDTVVPGHSAGTGVASEAAASAVASLDGHLQFPFVLDQGLVHLKEGVYNWRKVVEHSAWSAQAGGFSTALVAPNGFARWPAVTKRLMDEIREEMPKEKVLLIAGGCHGNVEIFSRLMVCG